MKRMLLATVLLALASGWCSCSLLESSWGLPSDEGVSGGRTAPDFTLESLDGTSVTLSELRGLVVVLDFWAIDCPPCVESMSYLQDLHQQYGEQGVLVLAINTEDGRARVRRFVEREGYTFTVLLDTSGAVADAYGVWGVPHTVVVDREGTAHTILSGPQGAQQQVRRLLDR